MKLKVILELREHAVILAALRFAQDYPEALTEHLSNNDLPKTSTLEIDELAEHFNCDAVEIKPPLEIDDKRKKPHVT
jgi:hypothetical protein